MFLWEISVFFTTAGRCTAWKMVRAPFRLRYLSEQELLGDFPLGGASISMGLSFLPHIVQIISMTVLLWDGICFVGYSEIKEICLLTTLNRKGQPYLHDCKWILGSTMTRSLLWESSLALSFTTDFRILALMITQLWEVKLVVPCHHDWYSFSWHKSRLMDAVICGLCMLEFSMEDPRLG